MPNIIDVVLPVFFVIFTGYLIGKLTRISIGAAVDINLYVGLPALVFVSLLHKEIVLLNAAKIWAAAIIIMYGCLLIGWLVFKVLKQQHSGLHVAIAIMNTVNIPFPIIYLAYGAEGLIAATLFFIPANLSTFIFGTYTMAGKRWQDSIKEVFKLPPIYAAAAGLLCNFLNLKVPALIISSLDFLALMAIPLLLLILGYNLSRVKMSSVPTTLLASFLRVGVGLMLGLLAVNVLNISGISRAVVILDSAMPSAALTSILATKYDNEAEVVSSVVFLTTLASLIVIPLLLSMLG